MHIGASAPLPPSARQRLLVASLVLGHVEPAPHAGSGPVWNGAAEGADQDWQALVDGRLQALHRLDIDGRRCLVTRASGESARRPRRGLDERQKHMLARARTGCSLKVIAIDNGLSIGTVSAVVTSGLRKLGLASRAELIQMLGAARGGTAEGLPAPRGLSTARLSIEDHDYVVFRFGSSPSHAAALPTSLTDAERAVATLILEGLSNQEIARAKRRSPRTIANQIGTLFRKLRVCSRVELAALLSQPRAG
jgi:DNA-binding NarL/FixJ family response regulator